MTYRQAKAKLEKCKEEIKRLSRKIEAQELELEGLVKLCELLGKYELPIVDNSSSTPVVVATEETVIGA